MSSPVLRVLVVGLDMGDGAALRRWCEQGELPGVKALLESGTWVDLESTAEVLHTSTWPTFATGCLPGAHGVYYPYQPAPGHQQARPIPKNQYHRPSFWRIADENGCKSVVYDVPETFPEAGLSGPAVFDFGTWAWYGERASQPDELIAQIKSRFGDYPLKMEAKRLGLKLPDRKMLERRLLASVEHKRASMQWLLDRQEWRLGVVVFGETHPAGHYLWPAGASAVDDGPVRNFEPMLNVYRAIDAAIAELRARLPAGTLLLVVSGDGVRPNNCGWHLLPAVLERLGLSVPPGAQEGGTAKRGSFLSLGAIKALFPPSARRFIADHLPYRLRDLIGASIQSERIDWSRTRAFALPTDLEGYIRVNLEGREPNGIVPPADYEALCAEISAQMLELVNPATGRPAVERVWIRNDIFPGAAQEHLPDLIVAWDDSAPIGALVSARAGTVAQASPDPRTGTHSTRAFMLACGPGISAGKRRNGHLADVAPTVLRLLGVQATSDMDGRALDGLLVAG